MATFNLTAQVNLQAPTNTSQVVSNIKKQLSGITANVQVKGDAGALAKINKQMQGVNKSAASSAKSVGNLNRNLSEAARRFSVITVATGTMLALARAIKNAVGEAIAFERELIKISQVTGKTVNQLGGLTDEVTRLSVSLGASSKDLLNVSRVLAQAGFTAQKTKQALEILAQTSLGATFDSIQDTTEGAIAVLRQFGDEAKRVGGDIKFLTQTMDAINSVSKKFAVESGDLITVIRRVGGVFSAAGGEVNELIALFTSVRATTRESAETIATGLRTIFTRIQRTDTVDQLAELGIQLRDSQGQFVGAYEAVRRLSVGLSSLDPRDYRFSEITESLGGFRQVGKVIPLIRQFTTAQDALNVAQAASGSTARDAATAQQSLQVQAQKVTQDFQALIRTLVDSSTFRSVAKGALEMASAFIRIVEAIEPLLPLITSLIALKIGSALAPGLGALTGIGPRRKGAGGRIHAFAKGGFVPGTGNRDTVPAMLSPGEFVIRKSSVNKMGVGALEAMNNNRFATGGRMQPKEVRKILDRAGTSYDPNALRADAKDQVLRSKLYKKAQMLKAGQGREDDQAAYPGGAFKTIPGQIGGFILKPEKGADGGFSLKGKDLKFDMPDGDAALKSGSTFKTYFPDRADLEENQMIANLVTEGAQNALKEGVNSIGIQAASFLKIPSTLGVASDGITKGANKISADMDGAVRTVEGFIFEGLIEGITGAELAGKGASFDFPNVQGGVAAKLEAMFSPSGGIDQLIKADAKRGLDAAKGRDEGSLAQKTIADIKKGQLDGVRNVSKGKILTEKQIDSAIGKKKGPLAQVPKPAKKAAGGKIDSVPALLTPGEYVVNKSAAQSIGYSNLNKMNQTGVQKFAAGGAVGFKRFAKGGPTGAGLGLNVGAGLDFSGVIADFNNVNKAFQKIGVTGDKLRAVMVGVSTSFANGLGPAEAFDVALEEIKNGSQAAAAAAAAAAAVPTGGDLAVQDAAQFGISGTTIATPTNTAADIGEVARSAAGGDQAAREALAVVQKQEIASITKAIRASDSGVTMTEAKTRAEGVVVQKYGILASDLEDSSAAAERLNKERETLTEKLKKSKVGKIAGGAKKAVGGAIRGVGKGAQKAQGLAQSAQQAVFFGSAIAATAIQMSGLSEVTKQAATETVAFAATLVAGGSTAIDMLANLSTVGKAAAAAEAAETTANIGSTTSEGAEIVADTGEAVASSAAAAPLLILVGIVLAVILAMKYFSAQAKAQADALTKGRKASLDRLGAGEGTAGDTQSAKDSVDEEFALRRESNRLDPMNMLQAPDSVGEGLGIAGATAAGALIGSFIPGIGTAVGALIGFGVGLFLTTGLSEENAEASRRQTESIYGSIDAIEKLGNAGKKFDDAMADLGKLPAATTDAAKKDRIQQEVNIGNELGVEITGSNIGAEFDKLAELAAAAGKTIGSLTEKDFDEEDAQGAKDLASFQTATQAGTQGLEQLAKRTLAARQTLAKAADLEITGDKSFQQLINEGGVFAKALEASARAIRDETNARIKRSQSDIKTADIKITDAQADFDSGKITDVQRDAIVTKAEEDKTTAQGDIQADFKRGDEQIKNEKKAYKAQADAAQARVLADTQAAAAAEVLRKSLLETSKFLMELNSIQFAQQETAKGLSNQASLQSGGDLDFSRAGPEGLEGDVTQIKDISKFSDEMLAAIQDLPPGLRAEAKKQLAIVQETSKVFSTGKENVLKQFSGRQQGKFGRDQQLAVIRAAGLDPTKLDKDTLQDMLNKIKDAAVNGIDNADFEDIFGGIKVEGEAAQANLQQINELRNGELANYSSFLDNLESERDKQLDGIKKLISVQQSNAELLAKARGNTVSSATKERGRTRSAQVALSGTGVRAGSVQGASQALRAAQQQRAVIAQEIKDRKASGRSIKSRMALDKKLQDIIKKTTAELERLSDQSARASDIMSEIDEEKAKREVITGLITDFVVGGEKERKAFVNANNGIVNAVRTGTLQNQSPEQRAQTVGLLDKLENIAIPAAGGLTGKEVKQELVFRDAIRMGLDPEVARQLATATSKEEQLIKALEDLTKQMEAAARLAAVGGIVAPPPPRGGMPGMAVGPWTGGYITSGGGVAYRADGGSIFQPKGTDTVPAMLTPGEYVIKKSAVDRVGVGALSAINSGRYARGGLVQYRQDGGSAGQAAIDSTKKFLMDTYGWNEKEYQEKMEAEDKIRKMRSSSVTQTIATADGAMEAQPPKNIRADAVGAMVSPATFAGFDMSQPLASPEQYEQIRKSEAAMDKRRADRLTGEERRIEKASRSPIGPSGDFGGLGDNRKGVGRSVASTGPKLSSRLESMGNDEFTLINPNQPSPGDEGYGEFFQRRRRAREENILKAAEAAAQAKKRSAIDAFFAQEAASNALDLKTLDQKSQHDPRHKDYHKWPANASKPPSKENREAVDAEVKSQYMLNGVRHSLYSTGEKWTAAWDAGVEKFSDNYNPFGRLALSALLPGGPAVVRVIDALLAANDAVKVARLLKDTINDPSASPELVSKLLQIGGTKLQNKVVDGALSPLEYSSGGAVQYRAGGGSIFQPRGTDTVPAMLTPGEFVIKKSSVDKIGRGNLSALNNGYANGGLVQYRRGGGGIGAGNTIESKGMMSSDQVKDSFVRAFKNVGLGGSLKILGDHGLSNDQRSAMFRLISNGQLKLDKLTAPNRWAQAIGRFKNYAEQEGFIKGAANGRLLMNGPDLGWMPPIGSGLGDPGFNDWSAGLGMYGNSIKDVRNELISIFGNQGTETEQWGGQSTAAGKILEQGLGWEMGRYGRLSFGLNHLLKGKSVLTTWMFNNMAARQKFTETKRNQLIAHLKDKKVNLTGRQIIGGGKVTRNRTRRDAGGNLLPGGFEAEGNPQQRVGGNRGFQNMLDLLQQQGQIQFAQGGNVPGTDTVPAMLTPGEFVMNKAAVAQHGVGYMKSLNRGRIPGFNRGGVVGHGGVQYKQNGGGIGGGGGVISIDPTRLQNVLTVFGTEFSNTLDRIIKPFDQMGRSLLAVANSLQKMTWEHTFKGDIGMSVNISNKDAIIAAVSEGLAPNIEQLIINTVDTKLSDQRFGQ